MIEKRKIIQDMVIEIERKIRNRPFLLLLKDLRELIISFDFKQRGGNAPSPLFFLLILREGNHFFDVGMFLTTNATL